nr:hypothetical protein [Myxococcota bacterium]
MVHGAALAIAPTADASCEVVWRVLAEARRLGVGSVVVVRRARDGSLAGQAIALVDEPAPDARGEVVIRVRPAYLIIERNADHSLIARTRGEDGLAADLPELQRTVARGGTRHVAVTFAGEARAADVLQVALALASQGAAPVGFVVR